MKVIDKRGLPSTEFCNIDIGSAFQDEYDDIFIKTSDDSAIYLTDDRWRSCSISENETVFPLEVTYTFENIKENCRGPYDD